MDSAKRWRRVEAVFEEAVVAPPEEKPALLARLCGDDPELRREVEALLRADQDAGDFLENPAISTSVETGRRLGAYRIERKIGEGGMGTVYLASRADQEYEQKVAVKIFGHRPDRADLIRRFRAERQILASLEHPGIARLLDGGTTDEGLPYLVMEHIDGVPIDAYCDEHRQTVEQRIDLFLEVCAAVAYAHRNLVVHRDLKPSNILVTADGSPRLLDFGIAKILSAPLQPTLTVGRWMTPHFASPEQISGRPVTTASDVYALGVLLYLLLTGSLPYRVDPERLGAVEQAVVEQEPARPSVAARAAVPPRRLAADLDNVVLMALAKDPQKRYGSVELLAQDLQRYRQGLPVAARAATAGYRLRKLVARHRLAAGLGVTAGVLIVGLAVTMTFQAVGLARQRDEIRRERDKAVQVTQFLQDMFRSPDPARAKGETVTAREILDTAAAKVETGLANQPDTQAALMGTIGTVYHNLGLDDRAGPLLEKSLALRRQRLGDHHVEVAVGLEELGLFHLTRGEASEAETEFGQALEIRRSAGGGDPKLAEVLNGLASALMLQGRYDEAEPMFREALDMDRTSAGSNPERMAGTLANLALLRDQKGDFAGAEAFYREALEIFRRVDGEIHPLTANTLNNLAFLLTKRGSFAEAEALHLESLAVARRVYGEEHVEVAMRLHNLAVLYADRSEPARAEAPCREAVARLRKLLGEENPRVAIGLTTLGRILEEKGDLAAAQQAYEEAVRIHRTSSGEKHPQLARTLANFARLLGRRGQPKEGEALARQAVAIQREALGPAHPDLGVSLAVLGNLRLAQGDPAKARTLLREAHQVLRNALSEKHWRTAAVARDLKQLSR